MARRGSIFRHVDTARVKRSVINNSHESKLTCDIGQLVPVLSMECIAGDYHTIGIEHLIRLQPLMAPLMHQIDVTFHAFFHPHRLSWDKWEKFFTREEDRLVSNVEDTIEHAIPKYLYTEGTKTDGSFIETSPWPSFSARGSLWDYLDYPTDSTDGMSDNNRPNALKQRAYGAIWYNYYRDQTLHQEGEDYMLLNDFLTNERPDLIPNFGLTTIEIPMISRIMPRCWEKDYFTTALPRPQHGPAVALPITGIGRVEFLGSIGDQLDSTSSTAQGGTSFGPNIILGSPGSDAAPTDIMNFSRLAPTAPPPPDPTSYPRAVRQTLINWLNKNSINLDDLATVDINEFRFSFALQRWKERTMRAGSRYTEALRAHFGVWPRDDRLQRPEYIGGLKAPVVISEVLQTSENTLTPSETSGSPQGNMSGHALSAGRKRVIKYHVKEPGIIMVIMSVMPRTAYQQGFPRTDTNKTVYDYFWPEFQNLGEQEVRMQEIYNDNSTGVIPDYFKAIFGFQARYNEYRYMPSRVHGEFRDILNYWHYGRIFTSPPVLNKSFVECIPDKRPFLVRTKHTIMANIGFNIRSVRPITSNPSPGLIDH